MFIHTESHIDIFPRIQIPGLQGLRALGRFEQRAATAGGRQEQQAQVSDGDVDGDGVVIMIQIVQEDTC